MKIYSWNVLFNNPQTERVFAFIRDSEWDIFCLQEVSVALLEKLKMLPINLEYRTDAEKLLSSGTVSLYTVTLSRFPIVHRGEIPFPEYTKLWGWRTRLFVALMRPFHFSRLRNRGGLFIDIKVGAKSMRVFNLHLILAQPAWRLEEFERAMAERDPEQATIVCGDFNIVESPLLTPLNWLFGGRVSEMLRYRQERTHIEQRFLSHELLNPLCGKITHPFSFSQLDHILVSKSFSIKNATVIKERVGSDHRAIRVEVE